jgi:hypothetical protein
MQNSEAQEKYQDHLNSIYLGNVPKLKAKYNLTDIADETLMFLQHYLGQGDTNVYLSELTKTKDYSKAQAAVDNSILTRLQKNNPKAVLPKNVPLLDYLETFVRKLSQLD